MQCSQSYELLSHIGLLIVPSSVYQPKLYKLQFYVCEMSIKILNMQGFSEDVISTDKAPTKLS